MTFQEIQEKLKKCELALTSIKDGSYSNSKYTKEEALEKFNTIKESLEKKLNLLQEAERNVLLTTKKGETSVLQEPDDDTLRKLKTDPNIEKMKSTDGTEIKEDDLSDEEQEEITTETSHTEVVAKEVHKALIDALQETGHEVSEDNLSSLNPETFTITVRFKDNTQSDYSFEFIAGEVKLDGNIIVTTNKKGVTPILNKTIAKDNLVKYFKNLSEKKGKDLDGDGDIDSDDYMIAKDKAIKANIEEDESEPVVDKKGKYTGVRRLKLSDKDKETLKKIEDLLAKEKSLKEVNYSAHTKPKHFDICPGAESLRDELLAGGKTPKELGKWTYIHDELFKLEKDVLKSKKATDSDVKKAEQFASDLVNISRDLGIDAGKVNYLKGHVKKIKDVANGVVNEGEGDDHHYIKVPRREFKKAMSILDGASDGNFVKIDFVDNDGAGNVIIYFDFSSGYIASGQADAYMYDAVSDLQAHDVTVSDHSAELDEALDQNDPVLMRSRVAKMRADDMKKLDALKKANVGPSRKEIQARALVQKLKAKRAEIEREMENDPDIEPTGGPVADMYGDQLNKIDNAIEKAASVYNKPMDYDTAVGKVSEDLKPAAMEMSLRGAIEKEMEANKGKFETLFPTRQLRQILNTKDHKDLPPSTIKVLDRLKKKYSISEDVTEDLDIGHQDDEPNMLKQDAYEIAQYSIQLFKLLKHYESLDVEVDFPNWWQRKVMLAKDYVSKATHYLDFKTNEPAIDSQAAALQEDEEPTKADMAKEKSLAKKSALLQFIASMQKKGILDKDKKVLDKDAYKKELDAFKKNVKEGRNLNELSGDQTDALYELQNILEDAASLGEQARDIIRQSFPNMLSKADAYGAFDFGSSSNRYDTTLASIIEEIEEDYDEEEDVEEGKYKSDAQRKAIYATKAEKGELKEGDGLKEFEKEYLDTQFGDSFADDFPNTKKYSIESLYAAFEELHKKKGLDYEEFFELVDNGKIKRHSASKLLKPKAEKGELNEFTDHTFKGSELIDNANSNTPDMFGKQIFADLLPKGVASENDAFEALRAHDKSGLKQRMGPRHAPMFVHVQYHELEHEGESYRLHQRQYYNNNFEDKDPNFNPKVTEITLIKVVEKGDRQRGTDKIENLGTILVKTDVYTQDLHQLRRSGKLGQQHMEEVIKEGATCCGRCGRVHVKGSGCKRPYLKGKSHCRNK